MGDADKETYFEKIFREDIIEKRKAGRGAMHNSGRRGAGTKGVRSVKFAVDLMSAKDKRQYIKAGEIMQTNFYDTLKNIPSFDELQTMDHARACVIAKKVRENFTNKQMITYWNINNGKLYDKVYYRFEVLDKPHCRDKKKEAFHGKNYKFNDAHENIIEPEVKTVYPFEMREHTEGIEQIKVEPVEIQEDEEQTARDAEMEALRDLLKQTQDLNMQLTDKLKLDRGLKLSLEGEFKGQEILERMLKYVDNLIGENVYNIELSIIEKI